MAYFGGTTADGAWYRIEPRKLFILIWVVLYAVVLFVIFEGGFFHQIPSFRTTPAAPPLPVTMNVLVPKAVIPQGTRLNSELFTIEEKTFPAFDDRLLSDKYPLDNSYAATDVQPGSPILREMVSARPLSNPVIAKIPPGFRAVTISVNAESGVEGWVGPGAIVDVAWISTIQSQQAIAVIVENAEVLSAEHSTKSFSTDPPEPLPAHVTLKVSARDAEKIQLAKATGSISLNLRGSDDAAELGTETITVRGLMRKDDPRVGADSVGTVQFGNQEFEVTVDGKLRGREPEIGNEKKKGN